VIAEVMEASGGDGDLAINLLMYAPSPLQE
jgi:hypothetical protein